jgi:hypothetical protein
MQSVPLTEKDLSYCSGYQWRSDSVLQLSGSSVVVPGDTVSISVFALTKQTRRMSVMTFFQGDAVTMTATFKTLAGGLNYPAYIQLSVPDKNNLNVLIQNSRTTITSTRICDSEFDRRRTFPPLPNARDWLGNSSESQSPI